MQLVAYGAQDIYLTGNPQITFFKVVYRRHTNFSMEAIEQTMNGSTTVTSDNQTATCTISRNGDLIHKVYVTTDSVSKSACPSWEGSKLIKEVELEIGGQRIDRHYTEWNQVWDELCTDESKAVGLKAMKGDIGLRSTTAASCTGVRSVQLPLNFWFCRNVGLALPLIALQYHEVKLKFTWGLPLTAAGQSYACNVVVDYIYLDTDERRRFAQVSHEYLIEQIQKYEVSAASTNSVSANLNFNHPVKELIWTNESVIEQMNVASDITTVQLKLNGHDRFSEKKLEYFQLRQPYEYHSAVPRQNLPSAAQLTSNVVAREDLGITAITGTADSALNSETAVSAGSIAVMKNDTTPGGGSHGSGTEITDGVTLSTDEVLYVVHKGDVGDKLFVGRLYEISLGGTMAAEVGTVLATLTENTTGPATTYASTTSLLRFNKLLVKSGTGLLAAGFTSGAGAGILTISAINEFVPKGDLITQARTSKMTRKINVYSFGLKLEEHQPSGTCIADVPAFTTTIAPEVSVDAAMVSEDADLSHEVGARPVSRAGATCGPSARFTCGLWPWLRARVNHWPRVGESVAVSSPRPSGRELASAVAARTYPSLAAGSLPPWPQA